MTVGYCLATNSQVTAKSALQNITFKKTYEPPKKQKKSHNIVFPALISVNESLVTTYVS